MNKSYQYLDININKKIYKRLNAVQGDTKSRYILVSLYNNSIAFDLSNCSIKVFGVKSDEKMFFNYATIVDAANGKFEIELTSQALAVNGELKIQILVLGANQERLTTCTFFIDVDKTIINDNAIESKNEFTALTKGLSELAEYDTYKNNVLKHENKLNEVSSQLDHIENVKANKDDIAQISDGTPLFAASLKEMTDKSRIYVNTSDGYVYVNSNGNFVKSNILYQSTGIANGSITLEKLSKDLITDNKNSKQMYSDLYLAKTVTNEVYRWRDLEQTDLYNPNNCVNFDGSTKSIIVTSNKLSSTYDWFAVGEEISQFEASWDASDLWVVLKYNGSSQAVALHLNNSYNVRVFDRSSRVDYHSATIVNTSAKLNNGGRFRVSERSTNLFVVETQQGNGWIEWLNIDVSSIPNINSYKKGYGGIVYSGILGQMYLRNIKVNTLTTETTVESESLINEINNTIKLSKQNKLEIDKIKKEAGSSENGGTNDSTETSFKVVDLVMFMGQSNMAGRGVASQSPVVPVNHGYEFRAISDPTKLYNIVEPFGVKENNEISGVTESSKTGSMVSSFVSNYYQVTKVPIVAVSCSKGGTKIEWWQPNGKPLNDAIERHNLAKEWLVANGYTIRHDFMVWCQGCSDGDSGTASDTYKEKFKLMVEEMMKHGVEKCFIVRIGNHRDNPTIYDGIINAQTELGRTYENAVLVSTKLSSMATDGLMKDQFHYTQKGYNIVGKDAGINTAFYINNLKEPTMWDWENQNLYYSYKN